jgi:hypothetical protein
MNNHCTRTEFKHINQQRISAQKVGTLTEFRKYLQSLLVRGDAVYKNKAKTISFHILCNSLFTSYISIK